MRRFLPVLLLAGTLVASAAAPTETEGDRGWARLKALAGSWTAAQDGQNMPATFELVASDTAVVQKSGFMLVLHRDGDAIRATVFTDDDNQPRFRSTGLIRDSKTMRFDFVDATNVKPGAFMATGLEMDFQTPDVMVQRWNFKQNGRDSTIKFTFRRLLPPSVRR